MPSQPYVPDDPGEDLEVTPFDTEGMLLEERDHRLEKQPSAVYDVDVYCTLTSLASHRANSEESSKRLERITIVMMLRDLKRRLDVPSASRSGQIVPVNAY